MSRPVSRSLSKRMVAGAHLRIVAAGVVLALSAGCGILPKHETVSLYRPEPVIAADAAWPQANWQLQITRPYADTAHDSARILVRPQPGELQVYKGAAWTQPAPDLVLDTLLRAFGDSGRLAGISRRGEGVNARYELLLDLRRFESSYDDSATPNAHITLGARLVSNADNRVVASRVFDITTPATGTSVSQINRAFEQGLGDLATGVIGWTLSEGQRDATTRK